MRTVKEWIGKTDDSDPPPTVKRRVLERFAYICQCGCTVKIETGVAWDADHIKPISENGENRETNLQPLIKAHHQKKTAEEATVRSKVYAVRNAHYGVKKKGKWPHGKDSKTKRTIDGRVVLRNRKG